MRCLVLVLGLLVLGTASVAIVPPPAGGTYEGGAPLSHDGAATPPETLEAPLLIGGDELRCPHQCYRRGFCTRGACRCHRGFAGRSCEREEQAPKLVMPGEKAERGGGGGNSATATATATTTRAPRLKVCVMTCQVLQTSTTDDTDAVLPGLPLASHLARGGGHDVTLVYFIHDAAAAERHKRQWEQDARAAGVSDLHVVSITRHYYLPTHLAHAFEAYALAARGGGET